MPRGREVGAPAVPGAGGERSGPARAVRVVRWSGGALDVPTALSALRDAPALAAFDSAGGEPGDWSVVAWAGARVRGDAASFAELRAELVRHGVLPRAGRPTGWPDALADAPFCGGFIGALGYELATEDGVAALPEEPWGLPRVVGVVARDFLLFDHRAGAAWVVLEESGVGRASPDARMDALARALEAPPRRAAVRPAGPLVRHTPAYLHRARVDALRRGIRDGDVYQANLAHRFTRLVAGHPIDLHLALRERHPAPYAGYLALDGRAALLGHSPELLLAYDGVRARSRPIKGTAPRGADRDSDAAARASLAADPKERAELAMIVDLVRNDLGRIAVAGGVRVTHLARLESYASVHHLVADVEADPRPEHDALAILEALFPAASITGAPKLAAMERIAALEREGRGHFTGAFGCLSDDGRATFDVAIRSPVWRARPDLPGLDGVAAGEVSLRVGGGITWDSDPWSEERETLHKARPFLEAFEGGAP